MKLLKKSIFKIKDDEERHRNSSHMEEFQFQGRSPPYILHITNSTTKKRLKYGPQFTSFLEARDQVLEHSFDFQIVLQPENFAKENFEAGKTNMLEQIMENVHDFLVEAASNVASAAFKFLQNKELTENEAKEYCAKNMMLNLHSICSQISNQLKKNNCFMKLFHLDIYAIRPNSRIDDKKVCCRGKVCCS